jgi:tRNA pseudouridine55 synthase
MEAGPGQSQSAPSRRIPNGILLVDKPAGMTSHGVVARARRALGTRKVGHAGTLDPMATGLLVLGIGPATRLLTYVVGADKTYEATIRLGRSSSTDDAEGELSDLVSPERLATLDDASIGAAALPLTGDILQRPSAVSAIKVDGQRAYARVRAGEEVELAARPVRVSRFALEPARHTAAGVDVDATIDCSSGTYIRALARDLGDALGVGGHLTALRRTRVGPLEVSEAVDLEDDLSAALRPPAELAGRLFPVITFDAEDAVALSHGKRVRVAAADAEVPSTGGPIAALDPTGRLIGLIETRAGVARVLANFPDTEVTT